MLRLIRALAALAVLSAVLVAAPAAPAAAAQKRAAAEDTRLCHHPTWGGTYYCKYGHEARTLPDGTIYFVVVNINYQVWTRWRNAAGQFSQWTSLGGQVWHGAPDGTPDDLLSHVCANGRLQIHVRGTDGNWWYRMRFASGRWTPDWSYVPPGC
jgi:ABC-type sugar transport system substrate-binding protein